jgi:hypothetical protein
MLESESCVSPATAADAAIVRGGAWGGDDEKAPLSASVRAM